MQIQEFFDRDTWTLTYLVYDEATKDAVLIDPVWDYDPASSQISSSSVNEVMEAILAKNLILHMILETHAHADHLTAAFPLKKKFPNVKVAISDRITKVQTTFKKIYHFSEWFKTDGSQFDLLMRDHEYYSAGSLRWKVIPTPGHTPACSSYLFERGLEASVVFTGDCLFMPDYGTGRCDFPEGDAATLFQSVAENLFSLPDSTRVYTGHDYMPGGRPLRFSSTIGEEKKSNIQLNATTKPNDFVAFRRERDATLAAPRLLFPSIQINVNGGSLPPAESNGGSYLKIPLRINH